MLLGPEGTKDAHTLIAIGAPSGIGLQAKGLEFFLHPAHADPKGDAAVRQDIEGGQGFGRKHRIPVGQNQDTRADADALRHGGQRGHDDQGLQIRLSGDKRHLAGGMVGVERLHLCRHHNVIAGPDGVKAEGFRRVRKAHQVGGRCHHAAIGVDTSDTHLLLLLLRGIEPLSGAPSCTPSG